MVLFVTIGAGFLRQAFQCLGIALTGYFERFFHDLKSHIFNPPSFFSPIMVFLLILGGFPAQIKLKISLFISWM